MISLLAVAVIALPLAPRIVSAPDVTCPSPAALAQALVGLLPDPSGNDPNGDDISVELRDAQEADDSRLLVRIVDRQGHVLGERRLRPAAVSSAGCAERTQEVAVIVAAAIGQLRRPNALPAPPLAPLAAVPPARPAPSEETAPPRARSGPSSPRPESPPPPPAAPPVVTGPPRPPTSPPPQVDTVLLRASPPTVAQNRRPPAVGLALAASMTGGTVAPSATADFTLRTWQRLPISVGALYVAEHTLGLGVGQAAWWRLGLTVSAAYHLPVGRAWFVEAGAGGLATALHIEGRDLPAPTQSLTFDPAASVLLRVGRRSSRSEIWLGALLSRWLRPQGAFVRGSGDFVDLPRWEISVGLGGRFDLGVTSDRVPT